MCSCMGCVGVVMRGWLVGWVGTGHSLKECIGGGEVHVLMKDLVTKHFDTNAASECGKRV